MLLPIHRCTSLPRKQPYSHGFTLLETLLYLGLFGLVMVNLSVVGFTISREMTQSIASWRNLSEAMFIRDKINWLANNNAVQTPTHGDNVDRLVMRAPNNSIINVYQE